MWLCLITRSGELVADGGGQCAACRNADGGSARYICRRWTQMLTLQVTVRIMSSGQCRDDTYEHRHDVCVIGGGRQWHSGNMSIYNDVWSSTDGKTWRRVARRQRHLPGYLQAAAGVASTPPLIMVVFMLPAARTVSIPVPLTGGGLGKSLMRHGQTPPGVGAACRY